MKTLRPPPPDVTLRRNIEDIQDVVKNVDSTFGDVYLVSDDRRYFLAHRIVLVNRILMLNQIMLSLIMLSFDHCDGNNHVLNNSI